MPKFDIWLPSFTDQGMEGHFSDPQKVNVDPIEAPNFIEAVRLYVESIPQSDARYWRQSGDRWLMWGLTACPSEDATWDYSQNRSRPNRNQA